MTKAETLERLSIMIASAKSSSETRHKLFPLSPRDFAALEMARDAVQIYYGS